MNLPPSGPNPQKSKFFREVLVAFEFLEVFYILTEVQQSELMSLLTKWSGENENQKR